MISQATPEFWICFADLPDLVKARARAAYALWRENPWHPSLHSNHSLPLEKTFIRSASACDGALSACATERK
ncbi:hypothetical protein WCLP8_2160007 [uncultured Gammaproteobacteria bacterium]